MKKRIIILFVVMLVVSLLCLIGNAAESSNYNWKISHYSLIGEPVDKDVHWFADELNKRSNGRIKVDVYPSSQLGDVTVVQERIGLGDVEMQLAWLDTKIDKRLGLYALPYMVSTWEEVDKVYRTGSVFMNIIANLLEEQNIKLISGWPKSFGGLALTKLPPNPKDPDTPKNLKLRTPPQKSYILVVENLGYLATPLLWSEVYTSLQTGIVDGLIGGDEDSALLDFGDTIHYFISINDHFEMWFLIMNLDLWNSLSNEDQKLVQEVGLEVEQKRLIDAEAEQKYNRQRLIDAGKEVILLTDEELEKIAKKVRENVWPKVKEDLGPELVDEILNSFK
jgi:TRAP-type C4-dicarboxylate transport system substrate-binding protein